MDISVLSKNRAAVIAQCTFNLHGRDFYDANEYFYGFLVGYSGIQKPLMYIITIVSTVNK